MYSKLLIFIPRKEWVFIMNASVLYYMEKVTKILWITIINK